jgi:hypothetical protein
LHVNSIDDNLGLMVDLGKCNMHMEQLGGQLEQLTELMEAWWWEEDIPHQL